MGCSDGRGDSSERDGSDVTLSLSRADAARLSLPDAEGVYFQRPGTPALRYLSKKTSPASTPAPATPRSRTPRHSPPRTALRSARVEHDPALPSRANHQKESPYD